MAKIGVNERTEKSKKIGCSFILIDNKPRLTEKGTAYMAKWVKTLYLVTTNKDRPVYKIEDKFDNVDNVEIIPYENEVDLADLLEKMKNNYNAERITIQSGGTLNSHWIRQGLIDYVSIVIAPCLIGGSNTQSLIGGESLHNQEDLKKIKSLKLIRCDVLQNSYIHLFYDVIKETVITV